MVWTKGSNRTIVAAQRRIGNGADRVYTNRSAWRRKISLGNDSPSTNTKGVIKSRFDRNGQAFVGGQMGQQSAQAEGGQVIHAVGEQQQEGQQSTRVSSLLFHAAGGGVTTECGGEVALDPAHRSRSPNQKPEPLPTKPNARALPDKIKGRSLAIGDLQNEVDFSNHALVGFGDGDSGVVDHESLTGLGTRPKCSTTYPPTVADSFLAGPS